jgi:RNA polymerase sigma factor (sigma-70 family)
MSESSLARVLSAVLSASDPVADAELIRRFAVARDEAAFELLVRRHAGVVWQVCRSILRDDVHSAEDAFQATFLALARQAAAIGRGSVAGWLFRVARNAALRATRTKASRATDPLPDSVADPGPSPGASAETAEQSAVVADEIARLPSRLREPVILCYYEGHTHAEAAARLGWAVGTVASRVARAKDRLRHRLGRRGLALAAPVVSGTAPPPAPGMSPTLLRSSVRSALDPAAVPGRVRTLTDGVISAMNLAKWKLTAAAFAAVLGLTGGAALLASGHGGGPGKGDA